MKFEARNTILLGLGLAAYGMAVYVWESERFQKWREEFNASIALDHARWRRKEMIDGEMNVPDPESQDVGA